MGNRLKRLTTSLSSGILEYALTFSGVARESGIHGTPCFTQAVKRAPFFPGSCFSRKIGNQIACKMMLGRTKNTSHRAVSSHRLVVCARHFLGRSMLWLAAAWLPLAPLAQWKCSAACAQPRATHRLAHEHGAEGDSAEGVARVGTSRRSPRPTCCTRASATSASTSPGAASKDLPVRLAADETTASSCCCNQEGECRACTSPQKPQEPVHPPGREVRSGAELLASTGYGSLDSSAPDVPGIVPLGTSLTLFYCSRAQERCVLLARLTL